ncbi:hypothetical protein [Sphingomonas nostoxanthinifaciens]|uniref:hypothetical protein n=1 Tax=Sphingomonas nostoxanthinifaciens TaxID=2872652 RepID=UPI001CC1FA7B|nr:hypothetical protein [Sphingomonas nostoxanthinifaciens]UAK24374.1 hypothetical protein K8P63_19010 [Sphingomonas nostoxanthinifaciens]
MQQTVLLTAIRGPDDLPKYGSPKMLLRWYRRCILLSAMDQRVLADPMEDCGGSFTGPSIPRSVLIMKATQRFDAQTNYWADEVVGAEYEKLTAERNAICEWSVERAALDQEDEDGWEPLMHEIAGEYLRELDAIPHHFQLHLIHAAEIVGYKHPDRRIRGWWRQTYERLVHDMHLWPETEEQLDSRLGDDRGQWLARNDVATVD